METDRIADVTYLTDPDRIAAIATWLDAEEVAIERGEDAPDPLPLVEGWPYDEATLSSDCVGLRFVVSADPDTPGQTPRLFDPAIVAFLRLATIFGGVATPKAYLRLDWTRKDDPSGGQMYPKLFIYRDSKAPRKNGLDTIPIGRIVIDAPKGKHAKPGKNFYDWRCRNLRAVLPPPPYKPGEQTQKEAVKAVLAVYDAIFRNYRYYDLPIKRADYKALLWRCLMLAYRREVLRRSKEAVAA